MRILGFGHSAPAITPPPVMPTVVPTPAAQPAASPQETRRSYDGPTSTWGQAAEEMLGALPSREKVERGAQVAFAVSAAYKALSAKLDFDCQRAAASANAHRELLVARKNTIEAARQAFLAEYPLYQGTPDSPRIKADYTQRFKEIADFWDRKEKELLSGQQGRSCSIM